jgi:penicillin-binding protein 1C
MSRIARAALLCVAPLIAVGLPCVFAFLAADAVLPFPEARLRRAPATIVYDRDGAPLRIVLPRDEIYRMPVTLDEVPPELPRALIASEDRFYRFHPGVNPVAIARAAWLNAREGRVVSGASTIPMQIARMTEPKRRTVGGKAREAFRALQLDFHHSKRELLEIYLNLTPYGGNIEGVGAAAWFYFGKQPSQLSLGEIALLTTLPRSPNRYDPVRDRARALAARNRVLVQLEAHGVFPAQAIADARRHPLPEARTRAPFAAPHLCDLALARRGRVPRIATTIDRRVQRVADEQVSGRIAALRSAGIENAAAVVVDNETGELRALVGSAEFFDPAHEGQVNGATARRSPGSTLKPFLFAMAFDRGLIVPESLLLDIPTDFSGYVTENYDGVYRGRVSAREALVQSLNASSVRLLSSVGLKDFLGLLRRGGLATLDRGEAAYGLPIILGSGEVRLLDLTNLYSAIANGGVARPLRIFRDEPASGGERLLSPEASQLIAEILGELRRPDFPSSWDLTRDSPAVAWKTGTSYGHRDAWAVGFSKRSTIGVWVGNFDGRGQKGISGSEHAAPLLFDLFRAIEGGGANLRAPSDLNIEPIEVCAESRQLPGPWCEKRMAIRYIPGTSRLAGCTWHRRIFVDARSGERLLGNCVAETPHREATVVAYPSELVAFWRAQEQPVPAMPPLSRRCTDVPSDDPPRIVSPAAATPYTVRRSAPVQYQRIPLTAQAAEDAATLYWYQDGVLVASGEPSKKLFVRPEPGAHRLVVVDEQGRADEVRYTVE